MTAILEPTLVRAERPAPGCVRCTRASRSLWVLETPTPDGAGWVAVGGATVVRQVEAALRDALGMADVLNVGDSGADLFFPLHRGAVRVAVFARSGRAWVLDSAASPALETDSGWQRWYRNGQLHRDGELPAEVFTDESGGAWRFEAWWRDGKLHRDAGPAVVRFDSEPQWWFRGVDHTGRVGQLLDCLAQGGRVVGFDAPGDVGRAIVSSITGEPAPGETFPIPRPAWVSWIVAHRDEYFPELAAAMRARSMQVGGAVAGSAGATEGVRAAVAAAPRRRRL